MGKVWENPYFSHTMGTFFPILWEMSGNYFPYYGKCLGTNSHTMGNVWELNPILWERYGYPSWPITKMKPTLWEMYGETHTFPILWEFSFPILWESYGYPNWPKTKVKPRLWEIYGKTHTFPIIWVTLFPYYGNSLGTYSHTMGKVWELIPILWEMHG